MAASTETGSLILKADSSQIKDASKDLDGLSQSAQGAQSIVDALSKAFSPVASSIDRLTAAIQAGVAQMDGLATAQKQVVDASAKMDAANKQTAQSTQQVGESADEASARIKAMVAASLSQAKAQTESIAAGQRTVEMTDAQRAVMDKLNATTSTQADMNARGAALLAAEDRARKQATASVADQTGALSKLIGQIDPTVAAYERLDAMQAKLAAFKKSGAIGADDYALLTGKIEAMRGEVGKASHAMSGLTLNSSMARRELGRMISDVANGNWGRLQQTSLTLANYTGLLGKAFSLTGAAIAGVVAVAALFIVGMERGWAETEKLRTSLIATGNAAGSSAALLDAAAVQVGRVTGKWGDARKAIDLFAASGKEAGAGLGELALSAVNVSTVTGQSIDKAAQSIISLGNDPASAVAKLNEQYHFLTSAQYDQIAALEAEGKTRDAARIAEQAYTSAMNDRAKEVEDNAGWIIRSAHAVRDAWNEAWGAVKDIGKPSNLADQVKDVLDQIDKLTKGHQVGKVWMPGISADDPRVKALQAQLADLRSKQTDAGFKMVNDQLDARANADAISAQKRLSHYNPPDVTLVNTIKKANADRLAALYGVTDPQQKKLIEDQFTKQVQDANNAYQSALRKGASRPVKTPNLDSGLPDANTLLAKSVQDDIKADQKQLDQWAKNTTALKAYKDAMNGRLATDKAELQLRIDSIGMGQKEIQLQTQLIQIRKEADSQIAQLNTPSNRAHLSQDEYAQRLQAIKDFEQKRVAAAIDADKQITEAQGDWTRGFTSALANYSDQAANVAQQSATLFTNAFNGMSDALATFATTGKLNFKSLAASILSDLARIEMRIAVSKILSSIMSAWGGGSLGAGTNTYNSMGGISNVSFNAKGGIYDSPSLSAYSGQIVNRPTPFKFASGAGIMGEAGPEAIMPLKRGADGKLGVATSGSGGVVVNQTFNMDSQGGSTTGSAGGADAARAFADRMKSVARQTIVDEQRPGGTLWRMQHS